MRHRLWLFHFILPIAIGTLIYLVYRPLHLNIFTWVGYVGLYDAVLLLRQMQSFVVSEWVIFSLPNGLWAYSFIFMLMVVWGKSSSVWKTFFIVVVIVLSVGSELGQLFGMVSGTFCWGDVFTYSLGMVVGYISSKKYEEVV